MARTLTRFALALGVTLLVTACGSDDTKSTTTTTTTTTPNASPTVITPVPGSGATIERSTTTTRN